VRFNRQVVGEVEVIAAEGTYCNVTDATNIVVYRRPLPTTNFQALGTVLWDGLGNAIGPPDTAIAIITIGATQLHAQTAFVPSNEQVGEIVALMKSLTTAQTHDDKAKDLTARHALGGPENLAAMDFTGPPGFDVYDAWDGVSGGGTNAARRSVARGQEIFNSRPIAITGVGGLSDRTGTCAGCHRVANMGNTSGFSVLDIGISDGSRRTPDLPLYTLRNVGTGETRQSTDPGAAMVTGLWADVNKFKVPNLRALAARAPYFHNGSAATLENVVSFYNARFSMGMTATERQDLRNFLAAL
jgi:cytochrome c peroxidase